MHNWNTNHPRHPETAVTNVQCWRQHARRGVRPPAPPVKRLAAPPHAARARFGLLGELAASSAPRVRLLGAPSISGGRGGGTRGAATGAAGTAGAASERAPPRPRPPPPRPRVPPLPPRPRAPRPRPRDVVAAAAGAPRRPAPEALLALAPAPALALGLAPMGLRCHGGTAMPHSFCRWVGRSPSEESFLPA